MFLNKSTCVPLTYLTGCDILKSKQNNKEVIDMMLVSVKNFCKKIEKIEKRRMFFSKIKDYSKAPRLDYNKFINELQKTKDKYENSSDVYDIILCCAEKCVELIKEKKNSSSSDKDITIFEYSCYKALKNEIENSIPMQESHIEPAFIVIRRNEVSLMYGIFDECTVYQQRDKSSEAEIQQ